MKSTLEKFKPCQYHQSRYNCVLWPATRQMWDCSSLMATLASIQCMFSSFVVMLNTDMIVTFN